MEKKFKLAIIGFGFMGRSIFNGIAKSNPDLAKNVILSDKFADFSSFNTFDAETTKDNLYAFSNSEFILFSVKPQSFSDAMEGKPYLGETKVISIMAGSSKESIKKFFPNAKVCVVMPNTPCSINKGMVAVDPSDFDSVDKDFILSLFSSLGEVLVANEKDFSAITAISGSGPAYFYLFLKYLIDAGVKLGLNENDSKILATNTMIGAGYMVKNAEDKPIDELITAVCSKGGTTIEAVNSFNNDNLKEIVERAATACYNRANELKGIKKDDLITVDLYTDGACSGNPGAGGYAAILISGDKKKEIYGGEKLTTNNRMEIKAVLEGLKQIKKPCKVNVYSDSSYVCDAFDKGWIYSWQKNGWQTSSKDEVKNVDLFKELILLVKKYNVTFIKVKGHSDNELNNHCDTLAKKGCKEAAEKE